MRPGPGRDPRSVRDARREAHGIVVADWGALVTVVIPHFFADVVEDSIKIVAGGHAEVVAALLGRGGVLQSHQYVVQKRDAHRRLFKHFFTSGVSGELLTPLAVLIGVVTSRCVVVGCKKLRRSSSATWCKAS